MKNFIIYAMGVFAGFVLAVAFQSVAADATSEEIASEIVSESQVLQEIEAENAAMEAEVTAVSEEVARLGAQVDHRAAFMVALWMVESNLQDNAPAGDGDNVGRRFQIRPIYLMDTDVTVDGESMTLRQEVMAVDQYMSRYAKLAWNEMEIGGDQDFREMVRSCGRIHNGGPQGWNRTSTEAYGDKIVNAYEAVLRNFSDYGLQYRSIYTNLYL